MRSTFLPCCCVGYSEGLFLNFRPTLPRAFLYQKQIHPLMCTSTIFETESSFAAAIVYYKTLQNISFYYHYLQKHASQ